MLQLKKALLGLFIIASYEAYSLTAIETSGMHLVHKARLLKPMELNKSISFTVWLKIRNKKALDRLTQEVYDRNSPQYQHFLTPELYEQKFAPTKNAEQQVYRFFLQQGMQAKIVRHSIQITGTVQQIKKTLHVEMNYYQYQNNRAYANSTAPTLAPELTQYISGITGLNTIPAFYAKDRTVKAERKHEVHDLKFIWNNFIPSALPTDSSLHGFSGANLQKAYNINNIPPINGTHINGEGETLVIVDECGTNTAESILKDANDYFNNNGITPYTTQGRGRNFAIINSEGVPFRRCPNATAFSQEILLDVESSHTLAPGGNTVLVLDDKDRATILMDVIYSLIHNRFTIAGFENAYVISNSWGGPDQSNTLLETALQLAATSGISVNFSSGDCGDDTYATDSKCTGYASSPATNYPASSIHVTAVGATALFVDSQYRYAFETVWGTVKSRNGHLEYDGGTGGGISQIHNLPPWQNSISNFTAGGYTIPINHRAVPDIAMLGDPQTGLLIVSRGQQVKDGGTSLACPLFSATLTLVNQARGLLNKTSPIGHAAPYLYQSNENLLLNHALNLIVPPAVIISGATPPPSQLIGTTPAPASAFTIGDKTYGWDSSLTVEPENQFWNDAVGVGSPNIPDFVITMANM